MSQIYLTINNQQAGPYEKDAVNQMISNGQVSKDALGWVQGMAAWEPLSSDTFINLGIGNAIKQETALIPQSGKILSKRVEQKDLDSTTSKGRGNFQIGKAIGEAFTFYKANAISSITWLILAGIMGGVPVVNLIVPLMGVNFYTCVRNFRDNGEKMSLSGLFDFSFAFDKIIGPIVVGILISIGYACLIIPGIILTFMWAFTPCIQGDTPDLSFTQAMKKSKALAKGNYLKIFLFVVILVFLGLSGFILLGIGALITLPVAHVALYCAYDQCKSQ